jgi:hypothetical protein
MQQKVLAILLAIYLMFAHVGFGYAFHFCQDELKTVASTFEIEANDKDCCGVVESCCAVAHDTHDGCCSDIVITADIDDNVLPDFNFAFACIDFLPLNRSFYEVALDLKAHKSKLYISPPAHAPPLYALFSQRIFYS